MEIRICVNGHQVPQPDLKACPACGSSLAGAETLEVPDAPDAPEATAVLDREEALPDLPEFVTGLPTGLIFVAVGAVLGMIGWLTTSAADGGGTAAGFGVALLWLSTLSTAIGAIAIGVKVGVEDARGV